jgi:hypothetical protein
MLPAARGEGTNGRGGSFIAECELDAGFVDEDEAKCAVTGVVAGEAAVSLNVNGVDGFTGAGVVAR